MTQRRLNWCGTIVPCWLSKSCICSPVYPVVRRMLFIWSVFLLCQIFTVGFSYPVCSYTSETALVHVHFKVL